MTTLIYSHCHSKIEQEADSIKEAAGMAYALLECGDGWPEKIVHDGNTVWESQGPFSNSQDRLQELAGISTTN